MRLRGADEATIAKELCRIGASLEGGDPLAELEAPSQVAAQFARSKPHGLSRGLIVGGGVVMAIAAAAQIVGFVVFHQDFRVGPVPVFIFGLPAFLVLFVGAVIVDFRLPAEFTLRRLSTTPGDAFARRRRRPRGRRRRLSSGEAASPATACAPDAEA